MNSNFVQRCIPAVLLMAACSTPMSRTPQSIENPLSERAQTRTHWPTSEWKENLKNDMDSLACQDFKNFFHEQQNKKDGLKTDAVLVIHRGQLRYEWYDGVYNKNTPHCLWSASKSISGTLLGVAVQNGRVRLEDPLTQYYPAQDRDPTRPNEHLYPHIRVSDLLWMGPGFEWDEAYDGDIRNSSVLKMLYLEGYKDVASYAANAPMLPSGPGSRWLYSSGSPNILMGVLKKAYGPRAGDFPWDELFNPIGMKKVVFERDESGTFIGSSYVHTTARDFAKWGFLLMNNGVWDGKQILPPDWIQKHSQVSPAQLSEETPLEYLKAEGPFGGTLWLNKPMRGLPKPFPNAPDDLFFAAGHYGQNLLMFPSEDLMIVRLSHDKEYWSKLGEMTEKALACFGGDHP